MAEREVFAGADNAWRRMGRSDNLSTITGVLTFADHVAYEDLRERLQRRLLRFDRFTQRVDGRKNRVLRPDWELVDDFDIDNHLYRWDLPEPAERPELQEFIGTLMSRPLDQTRPLWEMYFVDNYDDGSALVVRLNHSLGDGFAMLYVLFGLADDPNAIEFPLGRLSVPDPPEDVTAPATDAMTGDGGTATGRSDASADAATAEATAATPTTDPSDRATTGTQSQRDASSESDSGGRLSTLIESLSLAGTATTATVDLLSTILVHDEPQTPLRGDLGPTKRAAWTDDLPLGPAKDLGRAHDATVNDVLLAVATGVLGRTLEARGFDTTGVELNATVPVNLKPMDERDESLGNYFGLTFVSLPVGVSDLEERIRRVRDRADVTRLGIQGYLMYQVLNMGGYMPDPVFDLALSFFEGTATGIISNVPGPMNAIEIAGTEVESVMFWNPQGIDQGLGLSIFTYDDGVRVGIAGDANIVPDPTLLTQRFEDEMATIDGSAD